MRSAGPRWADVIVGIAILLLATPLVIAVAQAYNEADARIVCFFNLRNISNAVLIYANNQGGRTGQFPRTAYDMKNPKPTWGTPYGADGKPGAQSAEAVDPFNPAKSKLAPAANDVTAAFFLLLRTQEIDPDSFVCPSAGQTPFDYGEKNTAMNWSNWPGTKAIRDHVSYSYGNPYPSEQAISTGWKFNHTASAEQPIAADMNPGTPALLKLRPDDAPVLLTQGNSLNHFRHGQNVLFADGHVSFHTTPFVGVARDNLYTFGKTGVNENNRSEILPGGGEGIVGPSLWGTDVVLLPTARDLGMCDDTGVPVEEVKQRQEDAAKAMHPRTPEETEELLKNFIGTYRMTRHDEPFTLEVTKDSMKVTGPHGSATYTLQVIDIRPKRARIGVTGKEISPRNDTWFKLTRGGLEIDSPGVDALMGKWQRQ